MFQPFNAWCPLKGQTYLNKPAAFSLKYVRPFGEHQALEDYHHIGNSDTFSLKICSTKYDIHK